MEKMIGKRLINIIVIALAIMLYIPARAQDSAQVAEKTIHQRKFKRLMHRPNTIVLDVRTPVEFAESHIPQVININVNDSGFIYRVQALDKSKKYLLYCRSGKRSTKALQLLMNNGFTKAFHLEGGILAWKWKIEKEQP